MAKQKVRNPYILQLRRLNGGIHRKTNKAMRAHEKQQTRKELNKCFD